MLVLQSPVTLRVMRFQNGATNVGIYEIDDQDSPVKVSFKRNKMLFEYSVEIVTSIKSTQCCFGLGTVQESKVKETWLLSGDRQELTIARVYDGGDTVKEVFRKKSSLEDARKEAEADSGVNRCNNVTMSNVTMLGEANTRKLDEGRLVGVTSYQQLGRCFSFSAVLASPAFKGLERTQRDGRTEYRRNSARVTEYPDSVVVELEVNQGSEWCRAEGIPAADTYFYPDDVFAGLIKPRFMLRWLGTKERDLGEVSFELKTEPWSELREPYKYFRAEIPTDKMPLSDELEVLFFTSDGKQIGCIRSHL